MADSASSQTPEEPLLTHLLIQQISDGSRSAKLLTTEQRQQCVLFLRLRGQTYDYIARFLSVNEKTIQRDIGEIRDRNKADPPSEQLARQWIGEYFTRIDIHHANLIRLAQDKNSSIEARIVAETQAARLLDAMMARLQSLGYLPQQSRQPQPAKGENGGTSSKPTAKHPPTQIIFTGCIKDLDGGEHAREHDPSEANDAPDG